MDCPRCGYQQAEVAIECVACGVILAKARPMVVSGAAPGIESTQSGEPTPSGGSIEDGDRGEQDLPLTTRLVRLVLDDPRTDPVLLGVRIILLLMLIVWTWTFARARVVDNAAGQSFLHLINLPFHEAGHILFIPFGEFMMVLGGSLFQLIVPASLMVVFLTKHRDVFGAAVTWWWTGESLVDLAPYIDDARTLQLVLIGGKTGAEVEGHDWERILTTLGWLHLDHTLGRLAHAFGVIIMLSALAWAACLIVSHWQRARPEPLEPI